MADKKVEISNVVAMIEKPIKDARIIGLSQWNGKNAIVIITDENGDK
ncbi:MAG: hypothetical protein V5A64_07045 [Candidatus Thermoplasmatota archaeon]